MNGLSMSNPPPLIRRHDQRTPMIDLDAMDEEAAELELARKAQLAASAPAPKPVKAEAAGEAHAP